MKVTNTGWLKVQFNITSSFGEQALFEVDFYHVCLSNHLLSLVLVILLILLLLRLWDKKGGSKFINPRQNRIAESIFLFFNVLWILLYCLLITESLFWLFSTSRFKTTSRTLVSYHLFALFAYHVIDFFEKLFLKRRERCVQINNVQEINRIPITFQEIKQPIT